MWSTKGPCETGVHYAPHQWNLDLEAVGTHTELDQSLNATFRFIHRVVLKVSSFPCYLTYIYVQTPFIYLIINTLEDHTWIISHNKLAVGEQA